MFINKSSKWLSTENYSCEFECEHVNLLVFIINMWININPSCYTSTNSLKHHVQCIHMNWMRTSRSNKKKLILKIVTEYSHRKVTFGMFFDLRLLVFSYRDVQ